MRRFMTTILSFILLINVFNINIAYGNNRFYIEYDNQIYPYDNRVINIEIDGEEVRTGDMPAIALNNRTLVPVREVFETDKIGADVEWNGDKYEVYVTYKDTEIKLKINSKIAVVNGKEVELDVPAKLIRDITKDYAKTMIPLRFVSEQFEYDVKWDGQDYKAILTSPVASVPEDNGDTNDSSESIEDPKLENEEALDSLESESAKRPLPTALKDNPVKFLANDTQLQQLAMKYTEEVIEKEQHATADVYEIDYVDSNLDQYFVVKATQPISNVKKVIWNDKLIIDIENANWDLNAYEKTFEDNSMVTSIRSSQFSINPPVTRIVFDLKNEGYHFNLNLSDDRKELKVTPVTNTLYRIDLAQNDKGDYIKVYGTVAPDVKAFRLSNPDRIVFDLPNTQNILGYQEAVSEGQYITAIRTAQFDETTTRIVVETDGQADYQIVKDGQFNTVIQFVEPSYNNIKYENFDNPTITLQKQGLSIDIDKITYEDNYLEKIYTIILPGDYTDLFGNGNIKVNDGIIESMDISLDYNGNTKLVIKENGIYEFRITEDDQNIYIKAFKPNNLYSKVIVVDAGHGGKDPGAMSNDLKEKDVNLDIVKYLKGHLDQNDTIKVYYTRLNDTYPTLQDRTDLANEVEADFFLSVHNNAFWSSHTGTETLYFPGSNTPGLNSFELADIFQDMLIAGTNMNDRGTKARDNLFVLKHTEMPAIIVEIAFLTNINDATKLKSETFKKNVANILYEAILKTFNDYPTGR